MNEAMLALVNALGQTLLHFLWQGSLLGMLAWLGLAMLRNARPQARYLLACATLAAAASAPLATFIWLVAPASGAGEVLPSVQAPYTGGIANLARVDADGEASLLPWIVAAWSVGASLLLLRLGGGLLWVRDLRSRSSRDATGAWQARAQALAARLGLRGGIEVRIFDGASPLALGWWKPVVLLPAALVANMPVALLEALLAHELAHVRRHDYLVNLLQGLVEALLFYHPVVWWLSRRIRHERELVADDLAAAALGDRRRLALALSELERRLPQPAAMPIPGLAHAAHGGHLMSRIQHLLRPRRHPLAAGIALPLSGLLLAGIALYAYAGTSAPATKSTAAAGIDAPLPPAPPAPPAAPAAPAPPPALDKLPGAPAAPPATPAPPAPPAPPAAPIAYLDGDSGYALVRAGDAGIRMLGRSEDAKALARLRREIDGDFLWVRRDGSSYVVRDAAVMARVDAAWKPVDALEARMQALHERMQPHQLDLERLQARMEREAPQPPLAMRAADERTRELAARQQELAAKQMRLAAKMQRADQSTRASLERDIDMLSRQMEAIGVQMEQQSGLMQGHAAKMERNARRMELLAREMEAAARPMEAIGADMEAIGSRIEREAGIASRHIDAVIEDALSRGLGREVDLQ